MCYLSHKWQKKMLCCGVVREGESLSERTRTWKNPVAAHEYLAWQTAVLAECDGTAPRGGFMIPVSEAHGQGQYQAHSRVDGRQNGVRDSVPG